MELRYWIFCSMGSVSDKTQGIPVAYSANMHWLLGNLLLEAAVCVIVWIVLPTSP